MNRSSYRSGFTLVEIMIVVVIIGLLAAMAIPAFQRVRQNSRKSSVENLVRQISGGTDQYMLENGVTAVSYTQLTGNSLYVKGDPVASLINKGLKLSLSGNSLSTGSNFSIGQGVTYSWDYAGRTAASDVVSGTW